MLRIRRRMTYTPPLSGCYAMMQPLLWNYAIMQPKEHRTGWGNLARKRDGACYLAALRP